NHSATVGSPPVATAYAYTNPHTKGLAHNHEVLEEVLQHELSEACGSEASKTFLNSGLATILFQYGPL
ncbi:MAG: hypothetical protein II670_04220, partial [Alphaproteobacteria bacterium]|nr:hypothetical protein [Alphaproteobacteria bacterium]